MDHHSDLAGCCAPLGRDMQRTLARLEGLHVEIIMKDISTVRHDPQRLWDWARIASEVAQEFGHP